MRLDALKAFIDNTLSVIIRTVDPAALNLGLKSFQPGPLVLGKSTSSDLDLFDRLIEFEPSSMIHELSIAQGPDCLWAQLAASVEVDTSSRSPSSIIWRTRELILGLMIAGVETDKQGVITDLRTIPLFLRSGDGHTGESALGPANGAATAVGMIRSAALGSTSSRRSRNLPESSASNDFRRGSSGAGPSIIPT